MEGLFQWCRDYKGALTFLPFLIAVLLVWLFEEKKLLLDALATVSLRTLNIKTLFLVSLASTEGVGELHALSAEVVTQGLDVYVFFHPWFLAKQGLRLILFRAWLPSNPCRIV